MVVFPTRFDIPCLGTLSIYQKICWQWLCRCFFGAKLNQGNEVARQNISKGTWVVSRVRIHNFLATKIEGTNPGASFFGMSTSLATSSCCIPATNWQNAIWQTAMWTNNGQCSSRICDLSNLRVAFLHKNLQRYFELSQFDQWNPAPLPKREVSQTDNLKGPRASPALQRNPTTLTLHDSSSIPELPQVSSQHLTSWQPDCWSQ